MSHPDREDLIERAIAAMPDDLFLSIHANALLHGREAGEIGNVIAQAAWIFDYMAEHDCAPSVAYAACTDTRHVEGFQALIKLADAVSAAANTGLRNQAQEFITSRNRRRAA